MTYKHGHCRRGAVTATYKVWKDMRNRCEKEKNARYSRYGGRGITVCERWQVFENFLADMGEKPRRRTLDRVDNDGNYEPSNCRWATPQEQQQNSTRAKTISFNGESHCVREWERRLGLSAGALWHRLKKGWSLADSLTIPNGGRQ